MADTRRDIIGKVKVQGHQLADQIAWLNRFYTANPASAGPAKDIVDSVNANVAAITASMAAYAAAAN